MRRVFVGLAAVAIVVLLVIGCGGGGDASKKEQALKDYWYGRGRYEAASEVWMQARATIRLERLSADHTAYYRAFRDGAIEAWQQVKDYAEQQMADFESYSKDHLSQEDTLSDLAP